MATVQRRNNGAAATSTTVAVTMLSPLTVGNVIAVWVVAGSQTATLTGVSAGTDTVTIQGTTQTNNSFSTKIFQGHMVVATAGQSTITATFGETHPNNIIVVHELSGINTSSPLVGAAFGNSTSNQTTPVSAGVTLASGTATAISMLIPAFPKPTITATSPYTIQHPVVTDGVYAYESEDAFGLTPGTLAAAWSQSPAAFYSLGFLVFKEIATNTYNKTGLGIIGP